MLLWRGLVRPSPHSGGPRRFFVLHTRIELPGSSARDVLGEPGSPTGAIVDAGRHHARSGAGPSWREPGGRFSGEEVKDDQGIERRNTRRHIGCSRDRSNGSDLVQAIPSRWGRSESLRMGDGQANRRLGERVDSGRVGHLILQKLVGHDVHDRWARLVTDVVHWSTGLAWGAQFGIFVFTRSRHRREFDLLLGPAAWLSSYAILPLVKVYKPIWQYDSRTLEKDLIAHMTFGSVTALTFAVVTRTREM